MQFPRIYNLRKPLWILIGGLLIFNLITLALVRPMPEWSYSTLPIIELLLALCITLIEIKRALNQAPK